MVVKRELTYSVTGKYRSTRTHGPTHLYAAHVLDADECMYIWCINLWCGAFSLGTGGRTDMATLGVGFYRFLVPKHDITFLQLCWYESKYEMEKSVLSYLKWLPLGAPDFWVHLFHNGAWFQFSKPISKFNGLLLSQEESMQLVQHNTTQRNSHVTSYGLSLAWRISEYDNITLSTS